MTRYRLVCSVYGRGALCSGSRVSVELCAAWCNDLYPGCQHWVEVVEEREPAPSVQEASVASQDAPNFNREDKGRASGSATPPCPQCGTPLALWPLGHSGYCDNHHCPRFSLLRAEQREEES